MPNLLRLAKLVVLMNYVEVDRNNMELKGNTDFMDNLDFISIP